MKETNWMENERVKAKADELGLGAILAIPSNRQLMRGLLQIVAEEAVKYDDEKRRKSNLNNLLRLIR
jgi:hypothetical protein